MGLKSKLWASLWIAAIASMTFSTGCAPLGEEEVGSVAAEACNNTRISPTYNKTSEASYCQNSQSYPGGVTITGTAQYKARAVTSGGLGADSITNPIRAAEVRVTNSAGNVVQCATTQSDGSFSFILPQGSATFTVSINSRGSNSTVKASVMDAPERKQFYSISKNVTATSTQDIGTLTAEATGDVVGGAFNIFDQIVEANEFLRTKISGFTVAAKVEAYWEKGFNPGCYFDSGGLSFYLPGQASDGKQRLFILGGINGDVDNTDTDHFDNSVILHEYGHFLEDKFTISESPGGAHYGNSMIDPRLALGEGWGNFFQAAVLNNPVYADTYGNATGSTGVHFYIDLEEPAGTCTSTTPGCDIPAEDGEGNFREFAITRFLWDIVDTNADVASDTIQDEFSDLWSAMTNSSIYLNTYAAFRDIGLLHEAQNNLSGRTDWDPLRTDTQHLHVDDTGRAYRSEYGLYIETGSTCADFNIDPKPDPNDNATFETSNLLRNNDFFHYIHSSASPATFTVTYTTASGDEADLDLFVYNENGRFGYLDDIVGYSDDTPDGSIATDETETVSISSLPAGHYLINLKVYAAGKADPGGPTDYQLKVNGASLCPASLP